jgi:ribosome biogenesis protein MAK21
VEESEGTFDWTTVVQRDKGLSEHRQNLNFFISLIAKKNPTFSSTTPGLRVEYIFSAAIMTRRKSNPVKVVNGGSIQSFDENALSALTARIEKGFGASKSSQQPAETNRGQKGSRGTKHQTTVKAQSKTKLAELARGTKRDIHGNAKVTGGEEPSTKQKNGKGIDDRAILLKEILALGGTEEDLDLVADAVSEEEGDDSNLALPDKSFRKELASFVAELGIEEELDEASGDGSDKEDMSDGWKDASDVNSSTGSDGGEDVEPQSTAPHKSPPEDPKRLVSTTSVGVTGLTDSQ